MLSVAIGLPAVPALNLAHADLAEQSPAPADAHRSFQEMQSLFAKKQYEAVIQKGASFSIQFGEGNALLPQVRNLQGLSYLATKRPQQAVFVLRRAANSKANPAFAQAAAFNLAAAQYESGAFNEADQTLAEIQPGLLDKDTQIKFHTLRSRVHQRAGRLLDSAKEILRVGRLLETDEAKKPFYPSLKQALDATTDPAQLEMLLRDFDDSNLADEVMIRVGQNAHKAGQMREAEKALRALVTRFPGSAYFATAKEILSDLRGDDEVSPNTVGLLLPLTGKFAKFGVRALQAIELAFKIYNTADPDNQLTLVVEDAGDEADTAVKALDRLVDDHHVVAVIGPLMSRGVDPVVARAQELEVPLISLSQAVPATTGDYIFQAGLTPQLQAQEVARYAIEKLKIKRFAILHPNDRFGEQYSQSFWDAVEAMGGEIRGIESYTSSDTDFRQPVDRLIGLHYKEARVRELEAMERERAEKKVTRRTRKNQALFDLPPIVDFEAVYIPDEPKALGQILPTFAFRDADGLRFLGSATWHSPELVQRAQNSAEGSIFTNAFVPESDSATVRRFVARFKAAFDQEPTVLEALAFDAAGALEHAISQGKANRSTLRDRLANLSGFPGVTGRITTSKDGLFTRTLAILSVKNGQIIEVPSK